MGSAEPAEAVVGTVTASWLAYLDRLTVPLMDRTGVAETVVRVVGVVRTRLGTEAAVTSVLRTEVVEL